MLEAAWLAGRFQADCSPSHNQVFMMVRKQIQPTGAGGDRSALMNINCFIGRTGEVEEQAISGWRCSLAGTMQQPRAVACSSANRVSSSLRS